MIVEVKIPQLPESVSEATLMSWHKQVGQAVMRDENLIDIETDKVILEIPSQQDGMLKEILVEDGTTVVSGQVIARIDTSAVLEKKMDTKAAPSEQPVRAMPAAAKLAVATGIDLGNIQGSGRDGRILKEDVQAEQRRINETPILHTEVKAEDITESANTQVSLDGRVEQRVPMSRLRHRIAERLIQSQQENVILTTFNEVNMQAVMDIRRKYQDNFAKEHETHLGLMSFFVKASIAALRKFPVLNASIDGDDIVYHGYFDIGIAISSPRGLVVPILRNADQMSLSDIERQIREYSVQAKEGRLALEDLTGGTFSITNGGVFGSMLSTPIINPPQAAILGMHAIKERAVVENGQIVARPVMYLALSYDHRLIDGRDSVQFLTTIRDCLEDPVRLLLEI